MATGKAWGRRALTPAQAKSRPQFREIPKPASRISKSKHDPETKARHPSLLFGKLLAFLRLVRFEHALMFALSVFLAELIAFGGVPEFSIPIILSLLVPVLSEMGAFAMNDLLDVETDRLNNKRDRPLVSGELNKKFAGQITIFCFLLAVVLAYAINLPVFLITLAVVALAALYNLVLKDLPLVGNIYIAFTMAIPFVFGNYVISPELSPTNLLVALLGFLAGLAREIVKSAEDAEGDRKARNSKTLPILIGIGPSLWIAGIIYALLVLLSLLPYHFYLSVGKGFMVVIAADLIFVYCSLNLIFSRHRLSFLRLSKKLSLLALLLGLVGILLSVLGH